MYRYYLMLLLPFCFSCNKSGEMLQGDPYFEIHAGWYYNANAGAKYVIGIDNEIIADTFSYRAPDVKTGIQKQLFGVSSGRKRLILKWIERDSIVLDTMINVNGKKILKFLTLDASDSPQLLADDQTTEAVSDPISPDRMKFRLYYAEPKLPDSVKLVFYKCNMAVRPWTYDPEPVDSIIVKRREFTLYKEMAAAPYARNSIFLFKLYDQSNGALIQDIQFKPTGAISYTIGFFETLSLNRTSTGNPIYKVITSVLSFGYEGSSPIKLDKFSDTRLFLTPW